jgi:Leucine-rich repeat (LRR) protein
LLVLNLSSNKLVEVRFEDLPSLSTLLLQHNTELAQCSLPTGILKLLADKQCIEACDFSELLRLQELWVYNGRVESERLRQLPAAVVLKHAEDLDRNS